MNSSKSGAIFFAITASALLGISYACAMYADFMPERSSSASWLSAMSFASGFGGVCCVFGLLIDAATSFVKSD